MGLFNQKLPMRDTVSYYNGLFPLILIFILSPGMWLFLWNIRDLLIIPKIVFSVFGATLIIALTAPLNLLLFQRFSKVVFVSLLHSIAFLILIFIITSIFEHIEISSAVTGNSRFGKWLIRTGASISYGITRMRFCGLIPLCSFVLLFRKRQNWGLSPAMLFAAASVPLSMGILTFMLSAR